MYRRGCEAAAHTLGVHNGYPCPICGDVFPEALLTVEHAPPESVGGQIVALTCKPCNDRAGYTVDAAISQRYEIGKFARLIAHKETTELVRGSITVGAIKIRVEISRSDDGAVVFSVLDDVNDPAAVERVSTYLATLVEQGRGDGEEFTLSSHARYHARHVQVVASVGVPGSVWSLRLSLRLCRSARTGAAPDHGAG